MSITELQALRKQYDLLCDVDLLILDNVIAENDEEERRLRAIEVHLSTLIEYRKNKIIKNEKQLLKQIL